MAIKPFPVGAAKARRAAVVDIQHPPTAAGPELDRQVEAAAGHGRGAAMALHQQGARWRGSADWRVVPGVGGGAAVAGKPQGLRPADRLGRQGTGRGGALAPVPPGELQLQQPGGAGGPAGEAGQGAVLGAKAAKVVEGQIEGDPAGWLGWEGRIGRVSRDLARCPAWVVVEVDPAELPAPLNAAGGHQLAAIPGGGGEAQDPLGRGKFRLHRQQRLPGQGGVAIGRWGLGQGGFPIPIPIDAAPGLQVGRRQRLRCP